MAQPHTTGNGEIVTREKDPSTELRNLLTKMGPQIQAALPRHITAERLLRVTMTAITKTPKLAECTHGSFFGCLLTAAQLGLEPNTPLGHGYLIPRWNGTRRVLECTWQTGYQGMIDLAYRSGSVTSIRANVVRDGDVFEWEEGLEPRLVHRPLLGPGRSQKDITFAYGVIRIRDAEPHFEVLPREEIDRRRMMNEAEKRKKFSPWREHYEAMARKTAVSAALKFAPKSIEFQQLTVLEQAGEGLASLTDAVDERIADAMAQEGIVIDEPADEAPKKPNGRGRGRSKSKAKEPTPELDDVPEGFEVDPDTGEVVPIPGAER